MLQLDTLQEDSKGSGYRPPGQGASRSKGGVWLQCSGRLLSCPRTCQIEKRCRSWDDRQVQRPAQLQDVQDKGFLLRGAWGVPKATARHPPQEKPQPCQV